MNTRVCPHCNAERPAWGFNLHVKWCEEKNKTDLLPSDSLINSVGSAIEFEDVAEERTCNCQGFDGQSFDCPIHESKVQCPHCYCIECEKFRSYMEPINHYRCLQCGCMYARNCLSGEYLL